jgi:molybdopterin-containing oxidoreductase family membrane subunit
MWFERFVIIVSSLSGDFLPSSWGYYSPTWVDVMTFVGSFGLFFTLFLLFIRYLPIVAMAEVKTVMPQAHLTESVHRSVGDYHGEIYDAHMQDMYGKTKPPSEDADA